MNSFFPVMLLKICATVHAYRLGEAVVSGLNDSDVINFKFQINDKDQGFQVSPGKLSLLL